MAANVNNIDVIIENSATESVPRCRHGPALLFSKYTKGDQCRRFYACSACRDRKECGLFYWEDEWKAKCRKGATQQGHNTDTDTLSHADYQRRWKKFVRLRKEDRSVCQNCGLLLLPGEQKNHKNQGHIIQTNITDLLLSAPTRLLWAKDQNKTFAQYLFSERTVNFTLSVLKSLKITHVLCVGSPRIHEAIQLNVEQNGGLESFLLDIDSRFMQFYTEREFCRYNMFNHYFFDNADTVLDEFLKLSNDKSVAMVTDPPFGGMVQALADSLGKIKKRFSTLNPELCDSIDTVVFPVLWFFPYFMEPKMKEYLPDFSMLDYKVDYDNHSLYKQGKKEKGSPVRIFTNLNPGEITLPAEEGYRYCDACKRYSAKENLHCDVCEVCPSKDGRTYKHCFVCDRCVKPNKTHCETCGKCELPDHTCGVRGTGCHVCGSYEHKRKDCPERGKKHIAGRKRKADGSSSLKKKKRKK